MSALSRDQAKAQLDEAVQRAAISGADAGIGAAFTAALAVLLAVTLAAVTYWRDDRVGLVVAMGVYGIALGLLLWWQGSRFRIYDRSWARWYNLSFVVTITLYTAGIIWEPVAFPGWAIFAPYCALVAVPGVLAAMRMLRR